MYMRISFFIFYFILNLLLVKYVFAQTTPTANLSDYGKHGMQSLVAGEAHTCAMLDNGSVKCWGTNGSGHLGVGDMANRGDAANEIGVRITHFGAVGSRDFAIEVYVFIDNVARGRIYA